MDLLIGVGTVVLTLTFGAYLYYDRPKRDLI